MRHLERDRDQIEHSVRMALRGVCLGAKPWPVLLCGPAGTGKTMAALCLLDACQSDQYHAMPDLCDRLIRADKGELWADGPIGGRIYPGQIWHDISEARLVVIDEIGARDRVSDFHYETLKRVLDCREQRPLVAISNLDLGAIERLYDDRIASRLAAGTVCILSGRDRRVGNASDEEVGR